MADLQGWSRGTWGEGDWGEFIPVSVTGEQSNTSVGTLTITADAVVQPTGVSSGVVLGTAIGEAESIYPVTGVQSNTATGTLEAQEGHGVQPTGVEINFSSGNDTLSLTANGDAQLSTSKSVFGASSLFLDGANDAVTSSSKIDWNLTDWTIEFWFNPSKLVDVQILFDGRVSGGITAVPTIYLNQQTLRYYTSGDTRINVDISSLMSVGSWSSISVVKNGTTHTLYLDGNSVGTWSSSQTYQEDFFRQGYAPDTNADVFGYIDELRISNSARYTSSYTVSDREFEPDSNTLALVHYDGTNGSTDFPVLTSADASVSATVDAGWGRNTWGSFAWGENITIFANLVGESMSTDIGTVTTQTGTGVDAPVTGNSVATTLGTVSLQTDQVISVTGFNINALLQNPTILADGNVTTSAPGDQMDTAIGSVNIDIFTQVDATAVTSTFDTGSLGMSGDANFSLTGAQANTDVGTVTTQVGTGIIVSVTGNSMQFDDGTATIAGNALVTPTGVEMSVIVGNMFSTPWANVVTGASNTWTSVAA